MRVSTAEGRQVGERGWGEHGGLFSRAIDFGLLYTEWAKGERAPYGGEGECFATYDGRFGCRMRSSNVLSELMSGIAERLPCGYDKQI